MKAKIASFELQNKNVDFRDQKINGCGMYQFDRASSKRLLLNFICKIALERALERKFGIQACF